MGSRAALVVAYRYLSASVGVPYQEGDEVEHVEGRRRRRVYVETAHSTGGNFPTSLYGRVLDSPDPSEVGMELELDERGVVKNRGKGSKAKADAAMRKWRQTHDR